MSSDPSTTFAFPEFWNYPPYFTLQPIPETQRKQKELWRSLILAYCRHSRLFQITVDDNQDAPPFANPAIQRELAIVCSRRLVYDTAAFALKNDRNFNRK